MKRRHARLAPVAVLDEPLEHARRLDGHDELGLGLELQVLDRNRNRIGARAELRAVDPQGLARIRLAIDDHELTGDLAALLLWDEAELLAIDLEQRLDVVEHGIRFGLLVEAGVVPVLRDVIGLSLGHDLIVLDERLGGGHHAKGLRKRLDRRHGECAGLPLAPQFKKARLRKVPHVAQRAQRKRQRGLALPLNLVTNAARGILDPIGNRAHARLLSSTSVNCATRVCS